MSYVYKCPICGNKLKEDYNYYDDSIHMTVEYNYICSKCGYHEECSYGSYRDGIDGITELIYCYNNHPSNIEYKRYKRKLWSYRKRLLRLHKIKGRYNKL